ncbi:hypothetical protein GCM10010407_20290 [Rarobacter incanus]
MSRTKIRWIAFGSTLPLALIGLGSGGLAVATTSMGLLAQRAYSAGNYSQAHRYWGYADAQTLIESWKAPFGQGTSSLAAGDYAGAIAELGRAYQRTAELPSAVVSTDESAQYPRCQVTHNLALGHEGLADTLVTEAQAKAQDANGADDPTSALNEAIDLYQQAVDAYQTAMSVRTQDGCTDDKDAHQREEQKRQEANSALEDLQNPSDNQDQSDGDSNDSDQPPGDESTSPDDSTQSDSNDAEPGDKQDENQDDSSQQGDNQDNSDQQGDESQDGQDDQDQSQQSQESQQEQERQEQLQERQKQAKERADQLDGQSGEDGGEPTKGW